MPARRVKEQAHGVSHQVPLLHLHVSLRTLPGHSSFSCPQWHCLSPAVWQCWLCPVTKVYLECCKSTPTQTHPQPVLRAQLTAFDLFFIKQSQFHPFSTPLPQPWLPQGFSRQTSGCLRHKGPSHLPPRTSWGQEWCCRCSQTPQFGNCRLRAQEREL